MHYYNQQGELIDPKTPAGLYSVTSILGIRDKPWLNASNLRLGEAKALERSAQASARGTKAHKAIQDYLEGMVPDLEGVEVYFESFLKWQEKYEPKTIQTEFFVSHGQHEYAGSIDYICKIDGEVWIIDWKTSKSLNPGMGLQLKAYQQAYYAMTGVEPKMGIVQLAPKNPDGGYLKRGFRFKEYDGEFNIFLAHKKIFDWMLNNKQFMY